MCPKSSEDSRDACSWSVLFTTSKAWPSNGKGHAGHDHPWCKFMYEYDVVKYIVYKCIIPVQIGPGGLGAPFCSYRTASPRCPSYKLAEPNVHRGRFLLQNGSPSWPLVTKWVTDFARLASARIRWLDLPFTEWWGLGVAILGVPQTWCTKILHLILLLPWAMT